MAYQSIVYYVFHVLYLKSCYRRYLHIVVDIYCKYFTHNFWVSAFSKITMSIIPLSTFFIQDIIDDIVFVDKLITSFLANIVKRTACYYDVWDMSVLNRLSKHFRRQRQRPLRTPKALSAVKRAADNCLLKAFRLSVRSTLKLYGLTWHVVKGYILSLSIGGLMQYPSIISAGLLRISPLSAFWYFLVF